MNKILVNNNYLFHSLLSLLIIVHLMCPKLMAQSTWDGGGSDNFWATAANWVGDLAPTSGTLNFGGVIQTNTVNNLANDTLIGGISFTNTQNGQSFTLSGNRIRLGGNIITSTLTGGVASDSITDVINLELALTGTRTITTAANSLNGNHHLTISGLISEIGGSFGITKNGGQGGILTLTNLNTFTGTVTLSSGTLSFNSIANSGVASALGAGGTIVTGVSSGSTGTLIYTGMGHSTNRQIQVGAGGTANSTVSLNIQSDGVGPLFFSNPNFNVPFATATATRTITLQGTNSGLNTISGIISDNNTPAGGIIALAKLGTGTWRLSGANAYTGTTTIAGGVLDVGDLASGSLGGSGLIFSGFGGVLQGSGTFTRSFSGSSTAASGQVTGASGGFSARGGTLTLDFGGAGIPVLLGIGTFTFGNDFLLGSSTADSPVVVLNPLSTNGSFPRTFTVASGVGGDYAELRGGITSTGSVVKAGPGLLVLTGANTVSGSLTISAGSVQIGSSNVNSGTTGTMPFSSVINEGALMFDRSDSLSFANVISGSGNVLQIGSGTITLSGDNTYTGTTTISAGVLQLGSGGTNGNLVNTNTIINNANLTINRSNSLSLVAPISGAGILTKLGAGTATLTGTNTYSGGTIITGGTLLFRNTSAMPSSGSINVGAGATLAVTAGATMGQFTDENIAALLARVSGSVFMDTSSFFGIEVLSDSYTLNSDISASVQGFSKIGSGTLVLRGNNSYNGMTVIAGGVLDVGTIGSGTLSSGGLLFSNNAILQGNGIFTRTFSGSATAGTNQLSGISGGFAAKGGQLTVNFGGSGANINLNTGASRFGNNFVFGSPDADSRVLLVNTFTLGTTSRTFTVNSGVGGDFAEFSGVISSSSPTDGITKAGSGLLVFSANNAITGPTTISAGTLQLGNGGSTGLLSLTSGSVSIETGATFAFNRSDSGLRVANLITGPGQVRQSGLGMTTLSAANTYTGGTTVASGALLVTTTSGSGTGSGPVSVAAGAILGGTGRLVPTGIAAITVNGQLAPGLPNAAGTLTLAPEAGDVIFTETSSLQFQLFGASSYDVLAFSPSADGILDFSALPPSGFDIVLAGGYSPQPGESFRLLDWGSLTGIQAAIGLDRAGLFDFSAAPLADGLWFWDTSAVASIGLISVGIVPEPNRALLLGLALILLLVRRRRPFLLN